MKVLIDDHKGGRMVVEARLIKDKKTTVVVELADGNVITRKKNRDIPSSIVEVS